jgi:hypothetical protein
LMMVVEHVVGKEGRIKATFYRRFCMVRVFVCLQIERII